ncbi:MAG: hypothetical protein AAGH41_10555 [Pseudomonadota bacterium]
MLVVVLAAVMAAGWQEAEIEATDLPSVEDLAFPELSGDFDGDGEEDTAIARTGDEGVEIALELSSTGETYVEALGADSLSQVEWEVSGPEQTALVCNDPITCAPSSGAQAGRDAILVTIDGSDSFLLRWDDNALETIFLDG